MINKGMVNQKCADVYLYTMTGEPHLYFKYANVTTTGVTTEVVYANAKGKRFVPFTMPSEGTITLETQLVTPKILATMLGTDVITSGMIRVNETLPVEVTGEERTITLTNEPIEGSVVYVYKKGDFGGQKTANSVEGQIVTLTGVESFEDGELVEVNYQVRKTDGVMRIPITDKNRNMPVIIEGDTIYVTEDEEVIPYMFRAYRAVPRREIEVSFQENGDPASVTLTFDLAYDNDGNLYEHIFLED
jgi:hypothetical protein